MIAADPSIGCKLKRFPKVPSLFLSDMIGLTLKGFFTPNQTLSSELVTHAALASIPSLLMMVASIFRMAVLIVLGGGSLVMQMLMALERLWSSTTISLVPLASCCFCVVTGWWVSG